MITTTETLTTAVINSDEYINFEDLSIFTLNGAHATTGKVSLKIRLEKAPLD